MANYRVYPRGGRGIAIPPLAPARRHGMPPKHVPMHGQSGQRSMSMDVQASQMMQRTVADDDIRDHEIWDNDPPYDLIRQYVAEFLASDKDVIDEDDDEEIKDKTNKKDKKQEDEVEETSTTANVRGYTLPLGMTNKKKNADPPWKAYARAWGRAELVNK